MRKTITLGDDAYQLASVYARAKGITLSAAINELIRKAQTTPQTVPEIYLSASGLPCFPPTDMPLTAQMVKDAECEFDLDLQPH